jgi:hypothetical protein
MIRARYDDGVVSHAVYQIIKKVERDVARPRIRRKRPASVKPT